MARIQSGRYTHDYEGDLVVFLIGMHVRRWWRPDVWGPTFMAMPKMLDELYRDPSSGFLGARSLFGAGGPTVIQYWSSVESLYAYALEPDAKHRPAWAAFNQRVRSHPGVTGVWHETYVVEAAETIYVDAPVMGLAAATGHTRVTRRLDGARARIDAALSR